MIMVARTGLRSPVAIVCAVALAVSTAAVVMLARAEPAGAATRSQVLASAYSYGASRGYHVGIAVMDTETGRIYSAGDHRGTFASESVVKTMIATRVFLQGRLHGAMRKRVYKMITQSDDQIASDLYGSVGGDTLITWIKKRFQIPNLGSQPRRAGWWGNTHITADGLVTFYAKLTRMKGWGAWLRNAMRHATKHGSDGFYQWFGLKSAAPGAAIKQGWGTDYDNWSAGADENTTGYVGGHRYAVAILARGSYKTYGAPIGAMLTATAKRLLPGGVFPAPTPVATSVSATSGSTAGGRRVTVHGTDLSGATRVLFGSTPGRSLHVSSSTSLAVTSPAHAAGVVRIRVVTSHGTSATAGPAYRFVTPPPTVTGVSPASGRAGTVVTVSGTGFTAGSTVHVGSATVSPSAVSSGSSLRFTAPASSVTGAVRVTVTTQYGTSPAGSAGVFTYTAPPAAANKRPAGPVTSAPEPAPSASPSGGPSAPGAGQGASLGSSGTAAAGR